VIKLNQKSIHHICLTVKRFEESILFYKTLGFHKIKIFDKSTPGSKGALLGLNNFILELFYYPESENSQLETDLDKSLRKYGTNHFGLAVNDLEQTFEELSKKGFKFISQPKTNSIGQKYVFLKDPNGIFVELIQAEQN